MIDGEKIANIKGTASKIKVIIAFSENSTKSIMATATVEAEYGDIAVKGTKVTLAHHVTEYRDCQAPCVAKVAPLEAGSVIVVSHVDLDTVGGCLALLGVKPNCDMFWEATAFIDLNGPHNTYLLVSTEQDMMNALWAWQTINKPKRFSDKEDITEVILSYVPAIEAIISGETDIIAEGKKWASEIAKRVEEKLYLETDNIRAFITDHVFCASSYYSPIRKRSVNATVSMNTETHGIIIAFADRDAQYSASSIAKSIWEDHAGGHAGIAGSPREWSSSGITGHQLRIEFEKAVSMVDGLYTVKRKDAICDLES